MKTKFFMVIPFVLLITTVSFILTTEANIAHSIIITALSGLCGYVLYLLDKKKPNYVEMFNQELKALKEDNNNKYSKISKDISDVKSDFTKSELHKTRKNTMEGFKF